MILSALVAVTLARQGEQTNPPAAKPTVPAAKPQAQVQTEPPMPKPAVEIKLVKDVEGLRPLAFAPAPTGSGVAMTLEDNSVRIFDAATRLTSKILLGHPQPAYAIAWSSDGTWLATGDETARMFVWDTKTGVKLKEMRGHIRGIQSLSFNMPRTLLVSTGKDDVVKVWDPVTGKELTVVLGQGANLYSATFDPKLSMFAVGTIGSGARIYDKDGTAKNFLTNPDVTEVNDVAYNAAGTQLVTAGRKGNARLWDLKTFTGLGSFKGHGDWVMRARFSPNGRYLATSSTDRSIHVYDTKTFQKVADFQDVSPVGSPLAWTADGKWLLGTAADDHLQIYSVTPPQAVTAEPKAPPKKKKKAKVRRSRSKRH
ncbi:MAG: hypothetical protein QOJ65_357 [Fimbriimonadaceae bacterium]|jgi:WD40 repeat protein|nr:hypothetical protein [Fimbriimonadaceae bacterium]